MTRSGPLDGLTVLDLTRAQRADQQRRQVVEYEHVQARNMIVRSDHPVAGDVRMAGNPVKISSYDEPAIRFAAPEPDADRAAILETLPSDRR